MRILAKILIVLGILALVAAGMTASRDIGAMKEHNATVAELTEKRAELRATAHEVKLEYRAYQQSVPTMPDTLRMATGAEITKKLNNYSKQVAAMTGEDRELSRLIRRAQGERAEVVARLKWWLGVFGGGGAVLMLLGTAVLRFRS